MKRTLKKKISFHFLLKNNELLKKIFIPINLNHSVIFQNFKANSSNSSQVRVKNTKNPSNKNLKRKKELFLEKNLLLIIFSRLTLRFSFS